LYVLLFAIGFALRFGMVLWRKSYLFPPWSIFENLRIATNLATGHGFSSPFNIETGPTAWISARLPFILATVFKIFGLYSAVSMGVISGIQCMMAGGTGIAIHALAKRTVGAPMGWWAAWIWTLSPFFFRWPTTWIWDFTASALLLELLLILTLDVAETGSTKLWLGLGGLWGLAALTKPGAYQRAAVHNSLCSLCESSSGTQMAAWIVAGISAICGHYRALADSKRNSLRASGFLAQQLLG
jgi:4-amino-4-deoxy-L-arabinose transferase-like glycosyltransferase